MDDLFKSEKEKYQKIWEFKQYKVYSNECQNLDEVIKWAKKRPIYKILSVGCGEGYGIHWLTQAGFDAWGLDIVNVLKFKQYKNKLIVDTLWNLNNYTDEFDLIIAIDVLEHIPIDKIDDCLQAIANKTTFFYFSIACRPDQLGYLINDNLHLCVKPSYWWLDKIQNYFKIEGYKGGMSNLVIWGLTN